MGDGGLNLKNFFLLLGAGIILSLLGASPIQARNSAEALRAYGRGERLVKQGKTDAAIKEFEKAVRQAPANLGMRTRLAWLLSDQGRPQAAIPHFHFILARRPQDQNALLGLAIAQMRSGHPEKAVPVLDKGLRFYPGDALLLKIKGRPWEAGRKRRRWRSRFMTSWRGCNPKTRSGPDKDGQRR